MITGSLHVEGLPAKSLDEAETLLRSHGLRLGQGDLPEADLRRSRGLLEIDLRGPGIHGYLLGADGLEAEESDLSALARAALGRGGEILIRGWHSTTPGEVVFARTCLRMQNGIVGMERRLSRHPGSDDRRAAS